MRRSIGPRRDRRTRAPAPGRGGRPVPRAAPAPVAAGALGAGDAAGAYATDATRRDHHSRCARSDPARAGHPPPPAVVVADLHHATRADAPRRDRDAAGASLERDAVRLRAPTRDRIPSSRAGSCRSACTAGRTRAPSDPGASDATRVADARRPGEHETAAGAHEALDRGAERLQRVESTAITAATRAVSSASDRALRDVDVRRDREARDHRPAALLERRDDELPFPSRRRRRPRPIANASNPARRRDSLSRPHSPRDSADDDRRRDAAAEAARRARCRSRSRRRAARRRVPFGAATSMRTPPSRIGDRLGAHRDAPAAIHSSVTACPLCSSAASQSIAHALGRRRKSPCSATSPATRVHCGEPRRRAAPTSRARRGGRSHGMRLVPSSHPSSANAPTRHADLEAATR